MQEVLGYHLVELRRPPAGWLELSRLATRARAAALEVDGAETPVRFLRSIFVPEDEICFQLYHGTSAAVAEAVSRARLSPEATA